VRRQSPEEVESIYITVLHELGVDESTIQVLYSVIEMKLDR
jgi:hypothetical protein